MQEETTMALIIWSEDLSVGIKEIDEQHKKLVQMLNELHDAMSAGKSTLVMGDLLAKLIAYTQTHFQKEESYMSKYAYADLPAHKTEHTALTQKALDVQKRYKEGTAMVSIEVLSFLKNWLTTHIQGTDKKYAPFLNSKGLK
jgi:hemerythrin